MTMYICYTPTLQGKSLNVHENFSSKHLAINLILRRFIAYTIIMIIIHTLISIQHNHQFKWAYHLKAIYTVLYSWQSVRYYIVFSFDVGNQNVILLKLKTPSCETLVFVWHFVQKCQRIVICEYQDRMNGHIEINIKMLQGK